MFKYLPIMLAILLAVPAFSSDSGLEMKLTSHRAYYALDRDGKSTSEYIAFLKDGKAPYGPAVAITVELKNTGDKELIVFAPPRPQFVLKGARAESVCEIAPTQFQVAPLRRCVIPAGQSAFLNVISFYNPDKDEPNVKDTIKRLSYSEGNKLQCVNWTEPGDYTLTAVLSLGVSPAPAGAKPYDREPFAFAKIPDGFGLVKLESNTVPLTIREGSIVDYWSEALEDADPEVRFVAAHTLTASLPLAEATRLKMAACLKDTDARVRKAAARALQRPVGLFNAEADVLARDPAVVALTAALKDASPGVRAFAAAALATWGRTLKASIAATLPLLQDADPAVRIAAADALSDLFQDGARDEHAVALALIEALKDKDERVVNSALIALGRLRAAEAVAPLIPFCKNPNPSLSRAAIDALGNIGPAAHDAEAALFDALYVEETHKAAAAALGKIHANPEKLLAALITVLKSEDDEFGRVAIVRALGSCGASAVPTLESVLNNDKEPLVKEYAKATLAALKAKNGVR